VICISPTDKLVRHVTIPCQLPSSVTFGGPNLDVLFVTSISDSGNTKKDGPNDGFLFAIDGLGAIGLPEPTFELTEEARSKLSFEHPAIQ